MNDALNSNNHSKFTHMLVEARAMIAPYITLIGYNRKFLWLWLGGIISVTGNFLTHIAIVTIVNEQTASHSSNGIAVAAIIWCIYLPLILLMPFSGVIADLFDRRKVMLLSDLGRAVLVLLYLVVSLTGKYYQLLYVVLFLCNAVSSFFEPARESLVPVVVPDKTQVFTAKSVDSLTFMFCSFAGSSLGGLLTSTLGATTNFILDCLTFLASAFCILMLLRFPDFYKKDTDISEVQEIQLEQQESISDTEREVEITDNIEAVSESFEPDNADTNIDDQEQLIDDQLEDVQLSEVTQEKEQEKQISIRAIGSVLKNYFSEMLNGFKFLARNPYLLSLCLLKSSGGISWSALDIISLKYSDTVYRIGKDASAMFGITKAITGVSSGLCPVIIERIGNLIYRNRKQRRLQKMLESGETVTEEDKDMSKIIWDPYVTRIIIVLSLVALVVGYVLIYVSTYTHVSLFILGHIVIGCGGGTLWTTSTSTIYLLCPDKLMGRTMSVDILVFSLSMVISITMCGVVYDGFKLASATPLVLVVIGISTVEVIAWTVWAILCRKQKHDLIIITK
jgi:MFS family permease